MEDLQKKYVIKSFDSRKGKQNKLKEEEIDLSLYKASARCAAFLTSENRILFWVKALQDQYLDALDSNDDYHIKWIDHANDDASAFKHIELKISHRTEHHDTLLFTITVYLTTGVVMCQGTCFELWSEKEFVRLKQRADQLYSTFHGTAACGQEDQSMVDLDNEITLHHLEEVYEITRSNKKTKPVKTFVSDQVVDDVYLNDETETPEENQQAAVFETPRSKINRKRRNSFDSLRGLSVRSKASFVDLKSVVATLESDVVELQNAVTMKIPEAKITHIEDKMVQLENFFKTEINSLSARVIDLESDNGTLKCESLKLKNEIRSLKKQVKTLETKVQNAESENCKHQAEVYQSPTEYKETIDEGELGQLSNNPFFVLSDHNKEKSSTPHHLPADHLNQAPSTHQTSGVVMKKGDNSKSEITVPMHESQKPPFPPSTENPRVTERDDHKSGIILLMDSNGKFIDSNKFIYNKTVDKLFTPTIASAIETITTNNFDIPSTLVIHTGTNDIENSTLDSCFDNFQTLIDLAAQKYPTTKIIISSLITRNDGYDTKRSQLNNKISHLRPYANVHFATNENITQEMLHDRKHIKRNKIGVLVANLKDCIFNRISRRSQQASPSTKQKENHFRKTAEIPATPNVPVYNLVNSRPPPLMHPEHVHETLRTQKSYADALKTVDKPPADLNHETMLQLLKLYEMIRQN